MATRFRLIAPLVLAAAGYGQTFDDMMDETRLQDIRIEIHPSDWKKLQDNYLDNTYYPANFTWLGITVENVGIRSKGRTSRRASKPGLKVDFNRFEDIEFLGRKAILLDNNIQDFSMLKERMAMKLFEKMGLPAPRESHARVYINGAYAGVYGLVESTDKKFLETRWKEDDGYLYEYVFQEGWRFQYLGDNPDLYSPLPFKPETHENNPDAAPLAEMIRVVNQASDAEFVAKVSEYLDLKLFLTHLAVESYLTEYDGILSETGMNNLFFYRFQNKKLGQFIPKDKDNTFSAATDWSVLKYSNDNVLVRRALAVPELKQHYFSELLRVATLAGAAGGWLEQEIDRVYLLIGDAARADSLKECPDGACGLEASNEHFERFVTFIRDIARNRGAAVKAELVSLGFPVPAEEPAPAAGRY